MGVLRRAWGGRVVMVPCCVLFVVPVWEEQLYVQRPPLPGRVVLSTGLVRIEPRTVGLTGRMEGLEGVARPAPHRLLLQRSARGSR